MVAYKLSMVRNNLIFFKYTAKNWVVKICGTPVWFPWEKPYSSFLLGFACESCPFFMYGTYSLERKVAKWFLNGVSPIKALLARHSPGECPTLKRRRDAVEWSCCSSQTLGPRLHTELAPASIAFVKLLFLGSSNSQLHYLISLTELEVFVLRP